MVIAALAFLTTLVALPRWLRVAQREHYIPGRVIKIAAIWLRSRLGAKILLISLAAILGIFVLTTRTGTSIKELTTIFVLAVSAGAIAWPLGLSWRGRGKRLAWTPRMVR